MYRKNYIIIHKTSDFNEILKSLTSIGEITKEITKREIKLLLSDLKFSIYSKGTSYLVDAIQIAYCIPELIYNLSNLYRIIGLKNRISSKKISRSIRNSIDVMNNHISTEILCSFFNCSKNETVTPKYFFEKILEYYFDKKNDFYRKEAL